MTRCRVGELAVFVRSAAGNEGRIVRCIRLLSHPEVLKEGWSTDDVWEVDARCFTSWGDVMNRAEDCNLQPIRPHSDGARDNAWDWLPPVPNDISAEDPQDLREALKQWAEEQR